MTWIQQNNMNLLVYLANTLGIVDSQIIKMPSGGILSHADQSIHSVSLIRAIEYLVPQ